MATKTLTIMEDAYSMLLQNKQEEESFSDEIRRILSKRETKGLKDFFGILSEEDGKRMIEDLNKIKAFNISLLKKRII